MRVLFSKRGHHKATCFSVLAHRELKYMMHGFGDDSSPYEETVDLIEELVIEFISEMTLKAMEVGRSGKISEKDIEFLVRKDPRKLARLEELLQMNEELKIMRKDPKKYAEMMKEKFSSS